MKTVKRFDLLDGWRGLCAFVVVALHYCEAYRHPEFLPHSHLAVEYFFMLTGFTFIVAYDERWRTGGLTRMKFLWRRFVRLWPPILVGSFVGLLFAFVVGPRFYGPGPHDPGATLASFACSLTMYPQTKGFMTPMQPQTWTLLYIVYANLIYAFVLRHFRTWMLAVAVVAAAGYSLWVESCHHNFAFGWDFSSRHIVVACARMAFPVLTGMLLARLRWRISFPGAGLVATALLVLALWTPLFPKVGVAFGRFELVTVFGVLPFVLLCGAGARVPEGWFSRLCGFLGKYSFPLYATHFPLRNVLGNWVADHPDASAAENAAVVFAFVVAALALAYLCMQAIDALVRLLSGRK